MEKESLISQLASIDGLKNAWGLLNKENEDSYGLSGKTIKDFSQDLDSNLTKLSVELLDGSFRFSPTRAAVIKKDNGEYRPLQIPEVKDRVVLKALAIVLEEQLETILSKSEGVSFAYQQGKGVREAILQMKSKYLQGGKVILKADIVNFFEEVKKDKLLNELIFPNLRDKTINNLISDAMSQKLKLKLNRKYWKIFKNAGKGIPQGNPLSPLLSNVYLAEFDAKLSEAGYSLIRYADDFIVIFRSEEEAKAGYEKIAALLHDRFSLKIHSLDDKNEKTKIVNPAESDFTYLSVKFDGKNAYPSHGTVGYLKHIVRGVIKNEQLNSSLFASIYEAIERWIAIYSYLDIERYFDEIDSFVRDRLTKKFGKKKYKITTCSELAHRRRAKQYDKSKESFWRNPNLTSLLPNFIRHRFERNRTQIEASSGVS